MPGRHRDDACEFIRQQGLSPDNCYLVKAGTRYVLVTRMEDGQELEWFDDRDERTQKETWRLLIEAGVQVRAT